MAPCATAGSISSVERIEVACRGKAEPFETGQREQGRVGLAFGELLQPRLDIAAKIDDAQIGPEPLDLRAATQRRGADDRARRKLGKGGRTSS